MAVGFGFYAVAIFSGVLVILTLISIKPVEERFIRNRRNRRITDPHPTDVSE